MRSVLVVDDQKIRLAAFQKTEKLFKKMYRIESDLESFQSQDQRRFEEWLALTFRVINNKISDAQSKVYRLQQMHNWMVALSRMKNIPAPKAYRQIKQEEIRYQKGSDVERKAIDELRRKREDFIRDELQREARREYQHESQKESHRNHFAESEGDFEMFDVDPMLQFDSFCGPSRSRRDEGAFQRIVKMSDGELSQWCENLDDALMTFFFVGEYCRTQREMLQMLRIWEALPHEHHGPFAKKFRRRGGIPIEQLIGKLLNIKRDIARAEAEQKSGSCQNDQKGQRIFSRNSGNFGFPGDFDQEMEFDKASQKVSANDGSHQEQIKIVYRKLARRLHPDMQNQNKKRNSHPGPSSDPVQSQAQAQVKNQTMSSVKSKNQKDKSAEKLKSILKQEEIEAAWRKQMWGRVQESYRNKDLESLNRLLQMTLLRTGALRDLTLSEIEESANWLKREVAIIEEQAASFKRMPAWGFSRKKDLTPLERKLEKVFQKDLSTIQREIRDLESEHFMLENL